MTETDQTPEPSNSPQIEPTSDGGGFKDPTKLTKVTVWLLYAGIAVAVVAIVSHFMEYQFLADVQDGVYANAQAQADADAKTSDRRQSVVGAAEVFLYVASGIAILTWIYRANFNARQLGAANLRFEPVWSVAWYFIPVANLWKPYQVMREIWQTSVNAAHWDVQKVSLFLPWWWTLWLISNALGQAAYRTAKRADDLEAFFLANAVAQAAELVSIPLSIVLLLIIRRIHTGQMNQFRGKDVAGVFE